MQIALITGSAGLVGFEASQLLSAKMDAILGIDADYRAKFFGTANSVTPNKNRLQHTLANYTHLDRDISQYEDLRPIFQEYNLDIQLIIHAAAQPSHDWSAKAPLTDHAINATGTLNLLELTRQFCPQAVFIHLSTNKVYGTHPNALPLRKYGERLDLPESHHFYRGISEAMAVDQAMHTPFGASKLAGDVAAQEYGRYFGLKTQVFRPGCITGAAHLGAEQHGFLAYLVKCAKEQIPYTIYGYEGKQVRDNIHARDLAGAFWVAYQKPGQGEVYNIGGGRQNSCSVKEAIRYIREQLNCELTYEIAEQSRTGDHAWWITDFTKFQQQHPEWGLSYSLPAIIRDLAEAR